ncbi:protein unc-13 homolog D-like isoform X2 [Dysidea avara]|uniref:protein unc-13 homolog D-like isoform X2 n=1 Tax=Dysidea avara TaxID=196820 RepID=UPI00331E9D03
MSFLSSNIFTKFKDAMVRGRNDFNDFGTSLTNFGANLSSKLKQASSFVSLANTINEVEKERGHRTQKRSVSLEMQWIDPKLLGDALKIQLNKLYGGTVIKSLSSIAEGEDEEAVVLEEQYPFGDAPTDEEASATCLLALKTLGSGCTPAFQSYLQSVLNLNGDKFSVVKSKLRTTFELDVQSLILAVDEIKDPDVSYPTAGVYCKAGVILSKGDEHMTLAQLEKKGNVKEVVKSKVHLCADTNWKEQLELHLLGRECTVKLELWEAAKHTRIQASSNARIPLHYSSSKKKKGKEHSGYDVDVLIGTVIIKVSSGRHDPTYFKTESFVHSTVKKSRGTIKYSLNRTSKQFKISVDEAIAQYKLLCYSVMNHDSLDSSGRHKRSWDGALTTEGTHLLRLHALQANVTELQQMTIQLSGLIDYLQWYLADVPSLYKMIEWILSCVPKDYTDKSFDEPDGEQISCLTKLARESPDSPLLVNLIKAFDKLAVYYEDVVTHHLFYFDARNTMDMERLRNHIRLIELICTFEVFSTREGYSLDDFKEKTVDCVKEGCKKWYKAVYGIAVPPESSEDDRLSAYTNVLNHINEFLEAHLGKFSEVFNSFWMTSINYAELLYYTLDEMIFEEMDDLIRNEAEIGTHVTYHLFESVRQFCKYESSMATDYGGELKCNIFPEWFEPFVWDWIDDITHKVKEEIIVLFDNDDLETSFQKYEKKEDEQCKECSALVSDCALEVKVLYGKLSKYWNKLHWPVPIEHYHFAKRFVKGICQLMTFYANKTEQKLTTISFFEETSKERISCCSVNHQAFVSMNSLDTCLEILKILPSQFDLNQCVCNLDSEGTEVTKEQAQVSLEAVIQASQEEIEKKLENVFTNIENKIRLQLTLFIRKLLEITTGGPSVEDAALPLCNFLSEIIDNYRKTLLATTLERFLKFLWNLLCTIIDELVNTISASKHAIPASTTEILQIFGTYFHASGNGLSTTALETSSYMKLRDKVSCKVLPTQELLEVYLLQLAEKQANSTGRHGTIMVNVTYSRAESYLFIAVLQCTGLILPHKSSGKPEVVSESSKAAEKGVLVEVYLLPLDDAMRKTDAEIKIEAVKKGNNPTFKEQVHEMTIPQEDHLDSPGTSVVFVVKSKGKLLGLSLISCKDVPRYGIRGKRCASPQLQRRVDVNKNRILPLIHHVIDDSQALKELNFRATQSRDFEAKQIVKIFTENK